MHVPLFLGSLAMPVLAVMTSRAHDAAGESVVAQVVVRHDDRRA